MCTNRPAVHRDKNDGITLQFAQNLKKILEQLHPDIRVILTRFPGETIYPLQNANFANRLNIDFYVSIHLFPETKTKPEMFLYYFSHGDQFITKIPDLFFCPYDQAHRINSKTTRTWANLMAHHLTRDQYKQQFTFRGTFGIPFKPLVGIKAPSVALEIGLKEKESWHHYVQPIADSLINIINK